jgi:hypothetical protein
MVIRSHLVHREKLKKLNKKEWRKYQIGTNKNFNEFSILIQFPSGYLSQLIFHIFDDR